MTDGIIPFTDIYCDLTPSQFSRLQKLTSEVHTGSRIASRAMLQIGSRLDEIKRILKQDKLWRYWCETEFENSHDTADRYIRAAKRFASQIDVAAKLPKTVLYYLTDEAPPEAAEVVLEHAKQGERITKQVAQEIAATFQQAAVNVIQEAISTQGTVTLNGESVTVLGEVGTAEDENGKPLKVGKLSGEAIGAAVTQEVAELLKKDKETVQGHIVKRGLSLGRTDFLKAGSLTDFSQMMRTGQTQRYQGKVFVSVWGIPEEPKNDK